MLDTLSATLVEASCRIAGTFDEKTITPEWLFQHGIISSREIERHIINNPEIMAFSIDGFDWQISPQRIIITTASLERNCGEIVEQLLSKPQFEKIDWVANQFLFEWHEETLDIPGLPIVSRLGREALGQLGPCEQAEWSSVHRKGEHRIVVSFESRGDITVVGMTHTREKKSPSDTLAAAARHFPLDRHQSVETLKNLLLGVGQ